MSNSYINLPERERSLVNTKVDWGMYLKVNLPVGEKAVIEPVEIRAILKSFKKSTSFSKTPIYIATFEARMCNLGPVSEVLTHQRTDNMQFLIPVTTENTKLQDVEAKYDEIINLFDSSRNIFTEIKFLAFADKLNLYKWGLFENNSIT